MKQLMRAQQFGKKKKKIKENFNFFLEKKKPKPRFSRRGIPGASLPGPARARL